jgi:O-acetyl-ADP-ribose deacetylase (regulator of RNase III)
LKVPELIIADRKVAAVEHAKKVGLGDKWYPGWDPLAVPDLEAIVSPANTIGEMSGGYDLALRNAYQRQKIAVQPIVQKSLRERELLLGQARALKVGGAVPWLVVVPTVIGKNDSYGQLQSRVPSLDIIAKGTYNLMLEAYGIGVKNVGTVVLGAGVGGVNYLSAIEAMSEGYFDFLDDHQ